MIDPTRIHLMYEPPALERQTGSDPDWTEQAACLDADPAIFIDDPTYVEHIAQALSTCARCPVAPDCLDTALAHDQIGDIGIWGGTTPPVRDQIRAGTLTRDDALHLQTRPYRPASGQAPMVTVTPDEHGDFTDDTGRVLITQLPAGDYMAFIDQRPVARAPTLIDACQAARTAQHHEPVARRPDQQHTPELVEVNVDEHGDHIDNSGRILITRIPAEPPYIVFLDNRLHARAETLNTARSVAHRALYPETNERAHLPATPRAPIRAAAANRHRPESQLQARTKTVEQTKPVGRTR